MPRRELLTSTQRDELLAFPTDETDLLRVQHARLGGHSPPPRRPQPVRRLGFAVQLCYVRFPGRLLAIDEAPYAPILAINEKVRLYAQIGHVRAPARKWSDSAGLKMDSF